MLEAYEITKNDFEFEHNYNSLKVVCSILSEEESAYQNTHKGNVCFICDSGVYGCMTTDEFEKLIS